MGRLFKVYLDSPRVYVCNTCNIHLAAKETIISKAFQGRHGQAYLFDEVYVFRAAASACGAE
jgi:hypothetical protein